MKTIVNNAQIIPTKTQGAKYMKPDDKRKTTLKHAAGLNNTLRRAGHEDSLAIIPESAEDLRWINKQPRCVRVRVWHFHDAPESQALSREIRKWSKLTLFPIR